VPQLIEVIEAGERLLKLQFTKEFKDDLVNSSFQSVYLVQETCHRACRDSKIVETQRNLASIVPPKTPQQYITEIVNEQGGRYKSFLMNFALGFQDTELEMFKWLLYPVLCSTVEDLKKGLRYNEIRESIQSKHPRGERLNPGNVTQALQSIATLQSRKNVKPFVLDYDSNNLLMSVVDTGFLIWINAQDSAELLNLVGLPVV
jgi:hypothetical protein